MELRLGYKHTDAGLIPDQWACIGLGSLISLQRGHDLTWRDRRLGNVPVMGSAGQNGFHDRAIANGPGVLLGRSGASFGEAHYCEDDFWPHNTALYVTNFRGNDPLFIFYLLQSIDFSRHNSGGAQQSLNRNFIAPIAVGVPPLAEQHSIAEALSEGDKLLEWLDRLITKKSSIRQAAMQSLLSGQIRLPGFSSAWDKKKIGDVATIVSGATPRTGEPLYWNGDIKWCTPTDITASPSKYLFETARTITRQGLESCGARLLPRGALLLCSRATIGEIKIAGVEICTNQGFKSLICGADTNNEFLYYKLLTMKQQMLERSYGSTFSEISKPNVAALEMVCPSLNEQIAIAEVLSDMDAELAALERRREKTCALRQGMMQALLTGKTRLV